MPPVKKKPRKRDPHFIKRWREHNDLTQEEAAELIGVTATTVGRVEKNEVPYSQDFLEQAAMAYGCSTADLLKVDPFKKPDPDARVERFIKLAPDEQDEALKYLEFQRSLKEPG